MAGQYRIRILGPNGDERGEITQSDDSLDPLRYHSLACDLAVNTPEVIQWSLLFGHPALSLLEQDAQIEIWRRDQNIELGWYKVCTGLLDLPRSTISRSNGRDYITLVALGPLSILSWYYILYRPDRNTYTQFTDISGETLLKILVTRNCLPGFASTAQGRDVSVTQSVVQVEFDDGRGPLLAWSASRVNLLEELQKIVPVSGGDMAMVQIAERMWEFRYYPGQLGRDLSNHITLNLETGTIANPELMFQPLDERTVVVVGGKGQWPEQRILARYGSQYSPLNHREVFLDARETWRESELILRGDMELDRLRSRHTIKFNVVQRPGMNYPMNYDLGDLVSAEYAGGAGVFQIHHITLTHSTEGAEAIVVEARDVATG